MSFVDTLQFYCVLSASDVGIGAVGTPLAKLREFINDENQIKKDAKNNLSLKTILDKQNACSEASDLYIEVFNFVKQTPIHGTDSVVNPNEIYTMRWHLTTVVRAMYHEDDLTLTTLLKTPPKTEVHTPRMVLKNDIVLSN